MRVADAPTSRDGWLRLEQLKAIALTLALSVVTAAIIAYVIKWMIAPRPTPETPKAERQSSDPSEHGEEGDNMSRPPHVT